jgi:hypothetical protein
MRFLRVLSIAGLYLLVALVGVASFGRITIYSGRIIFAFRRTGPELFAVGPIKLAAPELEWRTSLPEAPRELVNAEFGNGLVSPRYFYSVTVAHWGLVGGGSCSALGRTATTATPHFGA